MSPILQSRTITVTDRGIPVSLNQLVNDLKSFNQRADAVKLVGLIKDEEKRVMMEEQRSTPLSVDPSSVHPLRFVGGEIEEGVRWVWGELGYCRVVSHDVDMLGNNIFQVEYLDGYL